MIPTSVREPHQTGGFTLTEMAVVLIIVALLIGGMILPLSAQQDLRAQQDTQKTLADIHEAILGFAATQGRLPCPASPAVTGVENPLGGGACINPLDGFVPGITLGVRPVDTQGYAIDAWGQRIRYAVSTVGNTFTVTGGMNTAGLAGLNADLRVCTTAAGIFNNAAATPAGPDCAAGAAQTAGAVMILLSTGKNGGTGGVAADEAANLNGDRVFVAHEPVTGANEFDDLVVWLSPNQLVSRLVSAGRLP